MEVLIDHREPELFRSLFADADVVSVAQLPQGDFRVDDFWIFERKTVRDLCVSLVDGRLFRQALALLQTDFHPVYLIEGSFGDIPRTGVRREAVQGALITLGVFFGLPLLRALDPPESVRLMRLVAGQGRRFADGAVPRFGYRPKGRKARQLHVLQGLPGIGKKRAERLLEHFGGIEAVICADQDELAQVEGIGYPTAQAIRNLVREPPLQTHNSQLQTASHSSTF